MLTMKKLLIVLAIAVAVSTASVIENIENVFKKNVIKADEGEWWEHSHFYQIYPRSFKDSDNDGNGDLRGIIDKLEYLITLGVRNIWLSPIFDSPMADQGYDISNFKDINPLFGTMADFEELLNDAHNLGMAIILDFVPNHSSDEHEWFVKSENSEPGYENYYIWIDPKKEILENGTEINVPPNNWLSVFGGPAWTWSDKRQQYYFHQFYYKQPDLNFRNLAVVEAMKDVISFWLDKGVDGFRIDAIPHLFEEEHIEDEPLLEDPPNPDNPEDWANLDHIYTKDLNETFDMVYQWRELVDSYTDKPRVLMTEAYTSIENMKRYYGDGERLGASFTFNFILMKLTNTSSAADLKTEIDYWMDNIGNHGLTSNWVLGNHDNHRVATRHGTGRVDGLNMLLNILPGVGINYNGEEYGMENGYVSWEDTVDPPALIAGPDDYEKVSRDFERTPLHWDTSNENAGFNDGFKPWLPVSEKYLTNNIADQSGSSKSHLSVFREIMSLKKDEVLTHGNLKVNTAGEVLIVGRELKDVGVKILLFNVNGGDETVKLSEVLPDISLPEVLKVHISSLGSDHRESDEITTTDAITLGPFEAFVLGNGAFSIHMSIMSLLISLLAYIFFQ